MDLPEPERAHHRDQLAGRHRQRHLAQRVHRGRPGAVHPGHPVQLQHRPARRGPGRRSRRPRPRGKSRRRRRPDVAPAAAGRRPPVGVRRDRLGRASGSRPAAAVPRPVAGGRLRRSGAGRRRGPPGSRSGPASGSPPRPGRAARPAPAARPGRRRRSARALSRVSSCSDRIVAARWTCTTCRTSAIGEPTARASLMASSSRAGAERVHRAAEPLRDRRPAGPGDPVGRLAALVAVAGRLHQPVPLQPGQRRVDLPDVQRPGAAGARLQPGPQLVAVARTFREQGEQAVPDGHQRLRGLEDTGVCIPGMHGRLVHDPTACTRCRRVPDSPLALSRTGVPGRDGEALVRRGPSVAGTSRPMPCPETVEDITAWPR